MVQSARPDEKLVTPRDSDPTRAEEEYPEVVVEPDYPEVVVAPSLQLNFGQPETTENDTLVKEETKEAEHLSDQ